MSIEEIINFWQESEIELNEGASRQAISDLEAKLGFIFPESFKLLYTVTNGCQNVGILHSIWPLAQILAFYLQDTNEDFIPFADILLNSHLIGFRKDKAGIYKEYDPENPISFSLEEGLELIIADSDLIY